MITFRLRSNSGIPAYLQIVQQVERAVKAGALKEGDRLPTIKEVLTMVPLNPNTIAKAYRELEAHGYVKAKTGVGTFITGYNKYTLSSQPGIVESLKTWIYDARHAGLDDETIRDIFELTIEEHTNETS